MNEYKQGLDEEIKNARKELEELLKEKDRADCYEKTLENMQNVTAKLLLNHYENEVFGKILRCIDTNKYIIWSQVSFSAFLKSENKEDWYPYNKFYADFLLLERNDKKPLLIIEYSIENGHGKGKPRARDNFKKAICQKAELGFVELKEEITSIPNDFYENYESYIKEQIKKQAQNFQEVLKK